MFIFLGLSQRWEAPKNEYWGFVKEIYYKTRELLIDLPYVFLELLLCYECQMDNQSLSILIAHDSVRFAKKVFADLKPLIDQEMPQGVANALIGSCYAYLVHICIPRYQGETWEDIVALAKELMNLPGKSLLEIFDNYQGCTEEELNQLVSKYYHLNEELIKNKIVGSREEAVAYSSLSNFPELSKEEYKQIVISKLKEISSLKRY